jgi:transposase-like protein
MEDYPRTVLELEKQFSDEQACCDYLAKLRWPDGWICPRCSGQRGWRGSRRRWICRDCGYQSTVTAGTIFADTHTPLPLWFRAIWQITSQKHGASALGLQRVLGLGSYETAWTWLHKLRRAMVRRGRDCLGEAVEVDETYIGGLAKGQRGRPTAGESKKALVVIAAEIDGANIGRIRMRRIAGASGANLEAFIKEVVKPASLVRTDGWAGYRGLKACGFKHEVQIMKDDLNLMPRVHRVASLLKRWLLGTHQGAASPEHLDYYLDEFTFRFNRRHSASRGKLFYRLVQQAAAHAPAPYEQLIRPIPKQSAPETNG